MKKVCPRIYIALTIISSLLISMYHTVKAELRYTPNDPYPLYTADNPIAQYTFWKNCEPEAPARVSFSVFRQGANFARTNVCYAGTCSNAPSSCSTTSPSPTCNFSCNQDVPIGNIYGPWNMIALFYPEANGNNTVYQTLVNALDLTAPDVFGPADTADCLASIFQDPFLTDPNQKFGFFDVPIKYRKYGFRFEADMGIGCTDFGLRIQGGVVQIRQDACFVDLTCPALGIKCNVLSADGTPVVDTGCTDTSFRQCCLVNDLGACDCKQLVINGLMQQANLAFTTLGFNARNFCKTQLEDVNLALYWAHCYELNVGSKNSCWAHLTLAPYFVGEVDVPLSEDQNTNFLFSLPFGNNKHFGYSFLGGFTLNFIETIEVGFEAGFTKYSNEFYAGYPVPTNDLQQGIYPRRADLNKRPGTTWTFAATMAAYDFISCLSCFIQYRLLQHCQDSFCIINPILITPIPTQLDPNPTDNFVASNIKIDKLKQNSEWTSSFVDVHFTYDISEHIALGFVWQTPVRQIQAYRSTTVMGSLIVKF